MGLREADGLDRAAALVALFFLAILIVMSGIDVGVRAGALG